MTRVAVVIGSALIFAILGLVAGHLCVVAYGGGAGFDLAGTTMRTSGYREMKPEFLLGCYLAPPIFGAMIGFGIAIVSLRFLGPAGEFSSGSRV